MGEVGNYELKTSGDYEPRDLGWGRGWDCNMRIGGVRGKG